MTLGRGPLLLALAALALACGIKGPPHPPTAPRPTPQTAVPTAAQGLLETAVDAGAPPKPAP